MMARVSGRGGRIAASAHNLLRAAVQSPLPDASGSRGAFAISGVVRWARAAAPDLNSAVGGGKQDRPRPANLFRRAAGEGGAARPTAQHD